MNAAGEAVQENHVQIVHCQVALMKADGLTKPLEGKEFTTFANTMLCKA
jgi:hypothetical protein